MFKLSLVKKSSERISQNHYKSVRTDSDGTLNGILLREGLVDEVSVLISPKMAGGKNSSTVFDAPDLPFLRV
jgi:2,5-diamino-6-(ribosylamino)-4(3H)-pyrimidinone 5'-phosphate reductase